MYKSLLLSIFVLLLTRTVLSQDREFSTNLPLVFIDTNGRQIPDEPKVLAKMGIIWDEKGGMNHTSGSFDHYNGHISIETRGSTSQGFPKKSYGFETCNELGEDIDFPLLGLPAEEDWIFYGPYSDKSLIRNALTFTLAKSLQGYSSRVRFVELFLNKNYQGIYVLMEKIKREDIRVDIDKLEPHETSGEDLTGGYIIKIDKTTGSGGGGWSSPYSKYNSPNTYYQYEVPAGNELTHEQMAYIKNYVSGFEEAVYNRRFTGNGNYREYIDIYSFIDFTLINEVTKNIDGYRLSTFLHKDRNGKLKAGPIWDFNLAIGNANYYDGWITSGFQVDLHLSGDDWANAFWWKEMWTDTAYVNAMKCRWESLRESSWSDARVVELTDSLVNTLGNAVDRNFQKWKILGKYEWPNYYVANTHHNEIIWMKSWLLNRLAWLDVKIPGNCMGSFPKLPEKLDISLFPNPVQAVLNLKINSPKPEKVTILICNVNGIQVYEKEISIVEGEQSIAVNTGFLSQGVYFYQIIKDYEIFDKGRLVKL